ncbi:MAG: alpha/beta fold hydrolase [Candidatus Eisenbacteria bacterium]|uniref:Alpha/beta fold hydrolase n=1 Tax=Eiseniibacteriota bacterium TaxID=2212470 RepID=A0A7Y2EAI7_UNCEI|nr:alpha/beta fold hydrolase [Candidatus Eisenbacteria bacterium]
MVWILIPAAIVFLTVVAVFVFGWFSLRPVNNPVKPIPNLPPSKLTEVRFPSAGKTLQGWLVEPETQPSKGVVLLVHGWGSQAADMLGWCDFLVPEGWTCFAIDVRGHGRSDYENIVTMLKFAEDTHAAGKWLSTKSHLSSQPLFILGHSLGGAAALLALSEGFPAKAAIISSAFARLEAVTAYVLKKAFLPPKLFGWIITLTWTLRLKIDLLAYQPERTIKRVGIPLLLTHGDRDPVVDYEELHRLVEAAQGLDFRVLDVPQAGHNNLLDFAEYREGVLSFLQLKSSP